MAISVASGAQRTNTTDFSAAITPLEFVDKFGSEQYAIGETKNKGLLALSCKDARGVITSAYASKHLQEQFENAVKEGKEFALPENCMVAPWIGNDGRKNWTLYMQADLDLEKSASARISQSLSR